MMQGHDNYYSIKCIALRYFLISISFTLSPVIAVSNLIIFVIFKMNHLNSNWPYQGTGERNRSP